MVLVLCERTIYVCFSLSRDVQVHEDHVHQLFSCVSSPSFQVSLMAPRLGITPAQYQQYKDRSGKARLLSELSLYVIIVTYKQMFD